MHTQIVCVCIHKHEPCVCTKSCVYTNRVCMYTQARNHCVCTKSCVYTSTRALAGNPCAYTKTTIHKMSAPTANKWLRVVRVRKHHNRSALHSKRAQGIHYIPRAKAQAVSEATTAHTKILCNTHNVIQSLRVKLVKFLSSEGHRTS